MRLWRSALVFALCATGLLAPSVGRAQSEPTRVPRIAIGGLYPIGWVACLARHGLTRDLLSEDRLADLSALQRYDLVIVAGAPPNAGVPEALRSYAEAGGRLLLDYSEGQGGGFGQRGRSLDSTALIDRVPQLAGAYQQTELIDAEHEAFVPDPSELTNPQTLCAYATTVREPDGRQPSPDQVGDDSRLAGPSQPAMLLGGLGGGTVLLCGPQLGHAASYSGYNTEDLMLALVDVISEGRAGPQLTADRLHLDYNASARLTQAAAPDAAAPEPEPEPATVRADVPPLDPAHPPRLPRDVRLVTVDPGEEYELSFPLPDSQAQLLLRYRDTKNHLRISWEGGLVAIARRERGRLRELATAAAPPAGTPLVVTDRANAVVVRGGPLYMSADVSDMPPGLVAAYRLPEDLACVGVESVYFSDDFSREEGQTGGWEVASGSWNTAEQQDAARGANPFVYTGAADDTVGLALAGDANWSDYSLSAAVQPLTAGEGAEVGLGWNAANTDTLYLFRAAVRAADQPRTGGLRLVRRVSGQETVLATADGSLTPHQWQRLEVRTNGPELVALIDGQVVVRATDAQLNTGRIALLADHTTARFDDVLVLDSHLPTATGTRMRGTVPGSAGLIDLDTWAGPATAWVADAQQPGRFWRREVLFGDLDLSFTGFPLAADQACELLLSAGTEPNDDEALRLRLVANGVELLQGSRRVAVAKAKADVDYRLELRRRAAIEAGRAVIEARLNGETLLRKEVADHDGSTRIGFEATGFKPRLAQVELWSAKLADTTFDRAPVDWWIGSGSWELTSRWSCEPQWSWFGGVSREKATVWSKDSLQGDQWLDVFVGCKMVDEQTPGYEGPRQERSGDFNLTLCGDGHDPLSGYAFIVGPAPGEPAEHGRLRGKGVTLYRQGQEVARNPDFLVFARGHNRWANFTASRTGEMISLQADGQTVLTWNDPQPLPAGHAAVWTENNGVVVPRITWSCQALAGPPLSLH